MLLALRAASVFFITVFSVTIFSATTRSQTASPPSDPIQLELASLEKRGAAIEHAREQVLEILQGENGCSNWFREVDPDPAGVFRSLHFRIDEGGTRFVLRATDRDGISHFKHPWVARTTEFGGRNSVVQLNARGAFFKWVSSVVEVGPAGRFVRFDGLHSLGIASYLGSTSGAQVTTLLHELGHLDGRLPQDDDSWDGRSSQNTAEVLRNCREEIRAVAQKVPRTGN